MVTHTPKQAHPYHLVDPSPWPIITAVSVMVTMFGFLRMMHEGNYDLLVVGLGAVMVTMFFWWRDVVREAESGYHNQIVDYGLRYGMVLFIMSEILFFSAWFWAFFDASLFPGGAANPEMVSRTEVMGGVWPPVDMEGKLFNPWHVPLLNTFVLLSSGATVTWAHRCLILNDRKGFLFALAVTIALGVLFTSLQAYEYLEAAFGFSEGIYPSVFYMTTGFHGAHVIIGTIFLSVCWFRGYLGQFTPTHHFGFEAAAWYWHFVDVVWLFLFSFVYWWGGSGSY